MDPDGDGRPRPGATPRAEATVFAVRAPRADSLSLCLFDEDGGEQRLAMEKGTDGLHTATVAGIGAGTRYGFRAHGPWDPSRGLRHDPEKLLVDPWARAIAGEFVDHPSVHDVDGVTGVDTAPYVPRSIVVDDPARPRRGPGIAWEDTVIYETHVRGLTMRHPDVAPELRGTFLGAASEPVIEHLITLGVTAIELMPVAHHVTEPFLQHRGRTNYWGYSTLNWYAPHAGYATADDGAQVAEFARMVDTFHDAGLDVILDVVFNHTAEGDAAGPVLSMKGLDNEGWYRLDPDDRSLYVDWTGTGNTVATGSPHVREAVLAALRWWHTGLGVDGFRFDLAVTLGRDQGPFDSGNLAWLADPALNGCKLIAEPWDLGPEGYRVGRFGEGWAEWNDRYRDDVRDGWRSTGTRAGFARRLRGSTDLFPGRTPSSSVNFVTAHDGFTLADLVSYDHKHNLANGEENRDGHDDNRSWNSGTEGPTDDAAVIEIRRRRSAGLITTLLVSRGVPMLLGGDELGRSQDGNNNAYWIDDERTWYDWTYAPLASLVSAASRLRKGHPVLRSAHPSSEVEWLSLDGRPMVDWSSSGPLVAWLTGDGDRLLLAFNPTADDLALRLPPGDWTLELDSTDLEASGVWRESTPLPAWTVRAFAPS